MQRHAFGSGEYKYFRYPLPGAVEAIAPGDLPASRADRQSLARTAARGGAVPAVARRLSRAMPQGRPGAADAAAAQIRAGDYNCLHQDLYGDLVFPLQLTVLLSAPERDFTGGEFLLVEQRPRAQSKGEVVPLRQGEAVIFPVHHRPVEGTRGPYRVTMRHGVSRLRSGQRYTLGIIFHDAA